MILKDLGEFKFIDRIAKGIKLSSQVIKGIGDDAAVLKYTKNKYMLFTTDMIIEDKHFYRSSKPELIGKKSISCNVSDIAAMGGIPRFAVISIGLPGSLDVRFIDRLYGGIKKTADKFNISLVGGDTVNSENIIINIALIGEVEKENLVLRSSARQNDTIFVTGNIGGSIKHRHLDFTPRLREARFLVKNFNINSMIDVSDGLLADLGHILEESNKGVVIYENAIPVSKDAVNFDSAVRDGEDFELIFTLSEKDVPTLVKLWPFRTRLSRIGRILSPEKEFNLIRKNRISEKVKPIGFTHF